MRILGVDFTSRPRTAKPIVCAQAHLRQQCLEIEALQRLDSFAEFEALLSRPGPWAGGFDFPFGLPRALVEELGWPLEWRRCIQVISRYERAAFRVLLDKVRAARPVGRKYLHRAADIPAGSSSPMKTVNPPVALMLFEGAPRLASSGVTVHPCASGDLRRVAMEAYPGMLARSITQESYKADDRSKQNSARAGARAAIVDALLAEGFDRFGIAVSASPTVETAMREDPSGDVLDAALCAVQAAYAWLRRSSNYGVPKDADALEGWIIGPAASGATGCAGPAFAKHGAAAP